MNKQSIRVEEVQHTLRPVVPPITLPQKCISLLDSSINKPDQEQCSSSMRTVAVTTCPTTAAAQSMPQTLMPTAVLPSVETTASMTSLTQSINSSESPAKSLVDGRNLLTEANPISEHTSLGDTQHLLEAVSAVLRSDLATLEHQASLETSQPIICQSDEVVTNFSNDDSRIEQSLQAGTNQFDGGVHVSDTSQKRDVMQFFQEQEQSLHEHFRLLPQSGHKSTRPLIPKCQQTAGLEHLDNLIRLMEQLTSLKDENSRLRQRCDYLESTKTLLQAKQGLSCEESNFPSSFITPPSHRKHRHHPHRHDHLKLQAEQDPFRRSPKVQSRTRISNSEELEYLALADSSSDHGSRKIKSSMHKRSHSAGSLDIGDVEAGRRIKGEPRKSSSKPKMKSSKWNRVKKVITGQKFYEDLGTTIRTIRDRGRSSHEDYSNNYTKGNSGGLRSVSSRVNEGSGGSAREVHVDRAPLIIVSLDKTASVVRRGQGDDDPELTSEIWMGPPDWWEEYESRKEAGGPTTNGETNTVIEVTTMYLGTNKDTTVSTIEVPVNTTSIKSPEKCLTTSESPPHGTTSLSLKETLVADNSNGVSSSVDNKRLHKSASCKSNDLDIAHISEQQMAAPEMRQEKKLQRSAWGRVKDIIHTRKDSIRRKLKRDRSGLESEDVYETEMQISVEDQTRPDLLSEYLLNRRTARTSPVAARQYKNNESALEEATASHKSAHSKPANNKAGCSRGHVDMAAILGGNISEEFSKKMLEWEQLRNKKQFIPTRDECDLGSLDLSKTPREFPVCTIDLRDLKGKVPDSASDVVTTEESNTSMEVLGAPSISVDDTPRHRTGGFHSKMQEWEMLKFTDNSHFAKDVNSVMERKESKKVKDETRKSKRSREGKEKDQMKRQTERGIHKMDKGVGKTETGKVRTSMEQTRTSDCEEKLERLNGRINQIGTESSRQNVRRSLKDHGPARKSLEGGDSAREDDKSRRDSAEGSSADESSDASLEEMEDESCTTATQKCLTTSNIATLERANSQLLENLHKKEIDYVAVQEEVQKVNEKLAKIKEDHATEMIRFHNDLAMGKFAGPVKLEVGELEVTVGVLEEKIKMMENLGEKLASSMESAAAGKWQSIEAEETIHKQLVELIEQMRTMLVQASQTEEQSLKLIALSNFETLYAQAMKLQVQMNNLRLSHLERNREIMVIKRQLLLQEVNNLLLQADITRRETELYQFQEAKLYPNFKRWKTFGGSDRQKPQVQVELPPPAPTFVKAGSQKEVRSRQGEAPRINIPYLPEEMNLAPAASCSLPGPASPSSNDWTGGYSTVQPSSVVDQVHSHQEATHGKSVTDHDPSLGGPQKHVNLLLGTYLAQQQGQGARPFDGYQEEADSLKFPSFSKRVQPRIYPPEQCTADLSVTPKTNRESLKSSFKKRFSFKSARATTDDSGKLPSVSMEVATKTAVGGEKVTKTKPKLTTFCDSVPIHMEIAELRRVKRQVEKEASAVKKTAREECLYLQITDFGTLEDGEEAITRQSSRRNNRQAETVSSINDCSKTSSRLEGSENVRFVEQTDITSCSDPRDLKGLTSKPPIADRPGLHLQSTAVQVNSDSKSPVEQTHGSSSLRRSTEEEDIKTKDYCALSPRRSPSSTRGKPPLPRHVSPSRNSTSASPAIKKGPRSKSVGDIDPAGTGAITSKPLQEVISKFEKRATVCGTEDNAFNRRKTPSPTIHLPRVGLISRVRRIKPAAELMEESQRYRSGNSICANRILQRYFPKDDQRTDSMKNIHDNEDLSDISKMLFQDTARAQSTGSSRTSSDHSLTRTDSLPSQTYRTIHIARRRSSSGGPEPKNSAACLNNSVDKRSIKDPSQALNCHSGLPDESLWDIEPDTHRNVNSTFKAKTQNGRPCDISSAMSPKSEISNKTTSSTWLPPDNSVSQTLDSQKKQASHKSLPSLGSPDASDRITSYEEGKNKPRVWNESETDSGKQPMQNNNTKSSPSSTPSSPTPRKNEETCISKWKSEKFSREKTDVGRLSSCFQDKRNANRNRAETIAVLCEQSIFFDLGMFGYSQQPGHGDSTFRSESRPTRCLDPITGNRSEVATAADSGVYEHDIPPTLSPTAASISKQSPSSSRANMTEGHRPNSCSSEGDVTPCSPTSPKKKKSKQFLDSNCLQKSRKFFEISK